MPFKIDDHKTSFVETRLAVLAWNIILLSLLAEKRCVHAKKNVIYFATFNVNTPEAHDSHANDFCLRLLLERK